MAEARIDAGRKSATPPSPSPLAGEGTDEGAVVVFRSRSSQAETPPHPSDAYGVAHLLPRGEKGRALMSGDGERTFFWINLAQRRASLS